MTKDGKARVSVAHWDAHDFEGLARLLQILSKKSDRINFELVYEVECGGPGYWNVYAIQDETDKE